MLAKSPTLRARSQPQCHDPNRLVSLLVKLVSGVVSPIADGLDTEMAPKMGKKKAAGPAETTRTITRSAGVEAKVRRIEDLKVKFAGVGKLCFSSHVFLHRVSS